MQLKGIRSYIGKNVRFKISADYDKSPRMFVYSTGWRYGKCEDVSRGNEMLIGGDWYYYKSIREIEILPEQA